NAATRMALVVEDLRNACRNGSPHDTEKECNLTEEISAAVGLFAHRVSDKVRLNLDVQPNVYVRVPPDEAHHAVVNLLDNALQAVSSEGLVRVQCYTEEAHAVVIISDSGPGIAAELVPMIFEPFFTTKPQGRGTGLGLSMVRRMTDRYGGAIS